MSTATTTFSPETGMISQGEFLEKISKSFFPVVTTNKRIMYYNIPAAFDIEVSSFYQYGEKKACMYIWSFGILNWVTYGRTWDEYTKFIQVLSTVLGLDEEMRLVVYIENFGYEFQFMRKRFQWDKLFFLEERKPVYGIVGGIEYKCSWKLSSKSLEKIGTDLQKYKVTKATGDLDYSLIRTSKTKLSEKELGYCEREIRVMLSYIQEKIETDGDITLIPLTNTGYVRNFCRKACFSKYKKYRGLMSELTLEGSEYKQLKRGFGGGFTHASAKYSGKLLKNVGSFDFTSSYPAVMLSEKFPMSKSKVIHTIDDFSQLDYYLKNYCCLFDITIENVWPLVDYDHPISMSKLIDYKNVTVDNGRIVTADSITLTCTEQDFMVYSKFYTWENMTIHIFRIYEKAYLPTSFAKAILTLYKNKTQLKDVEGEEVNYMISKNMANASYGMTVTDIVRDEISYENDEYSSTKPNLDEAIEQYNEGKRRFLFYPWGVWITAYARANLFSGIYACGNDYVYSDTDSVKILNPEKHLGYIEHYNEVINRKLSKAAEFHGIDVSEFSPLNRKGVPKPIGVWDDEGMYDEFKAIGAKRYMTRKGDEYRLTVAGVNKKKAMDFILANYENPFDALADNLIIPQEYSGRLVLTYSDEECSGEIRDYQGVIGEYEEMSYIHMEPTDYTLTLSDEYKAYLNKIFMIKDVSW